jgi:hypothetical protein
MQNRKLLDFILSLVFRGWKNAFSIVSLFGILGFILAPFMNTNWKMKYSIFISVGILFLSFLSKIIRQYYDFFVSKDVKPKAIRIIQGDGVYKGSNIIVFNNTSNVSKNEILTMYCESSGARQPICLLRVLDVTENEIITDQYPSDIESIDQYFSEESRKNATYFTKNIDSLLLENQIIDGRK